jgi:hypothetical protein
MCGGSGCGGSARLREPQDERVGEWLDGGDAPSGRLYAGLGNGVVVRKENGIRGGASDLAVGAFHLTVGRI